MHFTHVRNLPGVVEHGLLSDSSARKRDLIEADVGDAGIKARRRLRPVSCAPGGNVGDYAPFYYAPRSPMMSAISHKRVSTWSDGCEEFVYLVTTVETLVEAECTLVFSDRNASMRIAEFTSELEVMDGFTNWPLMKETYWGDTPDEPNRKESRQAECLVHDYVPFRVFDEIVVHDGAIAEIVKAAIVGLDLRVTVRPNWYI
jgi:hypothetical protein